jgi:DNA-binding beta-propeller fold protein YncE
MYLRRALHVPALFMCALLGGVFCPLSAGDAAAAVQPPKTRAVKIIDRDESNQPLRFPSGLTYDRDSDEILITCPQKNKLTITTSDYFPYIALGSGRGLRSVGKSFTRNGLIYVCIGHGGPDQRAHIAVFDGALLPVDQFYFPDFPDFSPMDLAVGENGRMYVVGAGVPGVLVLDSQGQYLHTLSPSEEVQGKSEEATIQAVDIGSDGRLYFVSEGKGRVYVYDAAEEFLFKFGEKGGEPGKLSRPRAIAVDDAHRRIFLVDYQRHTVPVFSIDGQYLYELGGLGTSRGWFHYPMDVEMDGQGRLLVADAFNHRVQVIEFVDQPRQGSVALGDIADSQGSLEQAIAPRTLTIDTIETSLPEGAVGEFLVLALLTPDRETAETVAQELHNRGLSTFVRSVERARRGTWHQLFIGPYENARQAYNTAEQLRTQGGLPAIVKTLGERTEFMIPTQSGTASPGDTTQTDRPETPGPQPQENRQP